MNFQSPFNRYPLSDWRQAAMLDEPFSHQATALREMAAWFRDHAASGSGGILVLPTGGGKTTTALRFLCSRVIPGGYKVLWLAHTHHLLDQAFASFARSVAAIPAPKATLDVRLVSGTSGHDPIRKIAPTDDAIVATLQSITLAYREKHPSLMGFLDSAGDRLCVVFDEAHHAPAPSYRKLLASLRTKHPQAVFLGLTATPTIENPKKAGWLIDLFPRGIVHQSSASALMADGILARPTFDRIKTAIVPEFDQADYERWVVTYRDLPESIIRALAKNQVRNTLIADYYAANRDKFGQTIIFAERWHQCEQIAELLQKKGVLAGSVYHRVATKSKAGGLSEPVAERNRKTLEAYKDGKIQVLLNVKMLTEGTDVPQTKTVFLTRQTTSTILLTQMVGRALRGPKAKGTETAHIVSFEDNWSQRINWTDFDQLKLDEKWEDEIVLRKRRAFQLISIDLVRRLSDEMGANPGADPAEFRRFLPIGWYEVEFEAAGRSESVDAVRQLIMVFEDQKEGYERFLASLQDRDLSLIASHRTTLADVRDWIDEAMRRDFDTLADVLTRVVSKDLFHFARHVAQKDGEAPTFHTFEDRPKYDLAALARANIDADHGPRRVDELLAAEYESAERFWKSIYPSYELLKQQYNACVDRIPRPKTVDPVLIRRVTLDPADEPTRGTKMQVKVRDHQCCLCCGEDRAKLLQVDHIKSRYLGGGHEKENLQTLCKRCNGRQGIGGRSFRRRFDPELTVTPGQDMPIHRPPEGFEGFLNLWSRSLQREFNMFYRAAAVEKIRLAKTGRYSLEWKIRLHEGNEPTMSRGALPDLLGKIREVMGDAGREPPQGIRVVAPGRVEAAHFIETTLDARATEFAVVPNGSQCRTVVGAKYQVGIVVGGALCLGHNLIFDTFAGAYKAAGGGQSNNYRKKWEVQLPNSDGWMSADQFH